MIVENPEKKGGKCTQFEFLGHVHSGTMVRNPAVGTRFKLASSRLSVIGPSWTGMGYVSLSVLFNP